MGEGGGGGVDVDKSVSSPSPITKCKRYIWYSLKIQINMDIYIQKSGFPIVEIDLENKNYISRVLTNPLTLTPFPLFLLKISVL